MEKDKDSAQQEQLGNVKGANTVLFTVALQTMKRQRHSKKVDQV